MGRYDDGSAGSFPGFSTEITRACVMGEEDSVKNQNQEGYRSLWEMLQSHVRKTVLVRGLAYLQITDSFLNVLRVG